MIPSKKSQHIQVDAYLKKDLSGFSRDEIAVTINEYEKDKDLPYYKRLQEKLEELNSERI